MPMMGTWIDYSAGTVSGADMAAANITGAVRYVGIGGAGKRLTAAEYADHCAHGRQTLAVVEATTTDADGGTAAGTANAAAALADLQRETADLPPILAVFMANDKPTFTQADVDYLRAATAVLAPAGYVVGPYGFGSFIAACAAAGVAPLAWQAGPAPSRTGTSAVATFWQRQGGPVAASDGPTTPVTQVISGVTCDLSNQLLEVPMAALDDTTEYPIVDPTGTWAAAHPGQPLPRYTIPQYEVWNNYYINQIVTQLAAIQGALTAEEAALLAAIRSGGLDPASFAQALAPVLAPLLPADATPAQVGAAVVAALEAQLAK